MVHAGMVIRSEDITQHDITRACKLTESQIKRFEAAISAPGFCATIKPYPSVPADLDALRSVGRVIAVTAPLDIGAGVCAPHWMAERYEWLRYFGFDKKDIIFASEKSFIDGNVFVDDKASNVAAWHYHQLHILKHYDRISLLMDRPWNKIDTDLDGLRSLQADPLAQLAAMLQPNPAEYIRWIGGPRVNPQPWRPSDGEITK